MKLCVVGKFVTRKAWELQGVYDSEERARAACKSEQYFVGPVDLNRPLPDRTVPWPGAYFPLGNA